MEHGTFLGWIGDDVLHSLYRIADVCVVPSIYEPFGLVALEAMASGCPCIVADTGGLREVVPARRGGPALPRPRPRGARRGGRARARRRRARRPPGRRGLRARPPLRLGRRRRATPPSSTPSLGGALRSPPPEREVGLAAGVVAAPAGVGLDRVGPAQLPRRLAHPDDPRRDAADDGVRGHVAR